MTSLTKVYSEKCGICLEEYPENSLCKMQLPKKGSEILRQKIEDISISVLKCGHAYCDQCWDDYKVHKFIQEQPVCCPFCQKKIVEMSAKDYLIRGINTVQKIVHLAKFSSLGYLGYANFNHYKCMFNARSFFACPNLFNRTAALTFLTFNSLDSLLSLAKYGIKYFSKPNFE